MVRAFLGHTGAAGEGGRARGWRGGASASALRAFLVRRLDRSATTGLLLTLAFAITLIGTLLLGVLAVLVRRVAAIQHVDNSVAAWGYDHRGATSTRALQAVTNLGNIRIVVGLALVLVIIELYRHEVAGRFSS